MAANGDIYLGSYAGWYSVRDEAYYGEDELEERDGSFVIRDYSCPLAAVTPGHPEVCRLAETLIAELAGVPVRECCDRGKRPRCCFEVATPDNAE